MNAPFLITPATILHAQPLAAIHAMSFPPRERWDDAAIAAQFSLPGTFALITAEGGMILARVIADEAEILTFAVIPARRRRGLGRALLEAASDATRARGARILFLDVAAGNAAARALYTAAGFRETGRRPRYYADGDDALTMAREWGEE